MLVRLKESGGFVQVTNVSAEPLGASLEKRALICYAGDFMSMDGAVKVTEAHLRKVEKEHNSLLLSAARLVGGAEVPLKYCPPLQVDHSTSAHNTVGRLVGKVETAPHILQDGTVTLGLFGHVRVLGADNVEKVSDGRWIHLSIGADFEEGKISELTITPFPAAGEASLLSKHNALKGDSNMFKKLMAFLTSAKKLSAKDAEEKLSKMSEEEKVKMSAEADEDEKSKHERLKAHLKKCKKMSDDDAVKHLAECKEEDKAKLSAEADEDEAKEKEAKLAAEEDEKKRELAAKKLKEDEGKTEDEKKLSAARENLTRLSTDFRASTQHAMLAAKKGKISVRLSKLKAECKITPAEIKKIDLTKLSAENDATIDAVLDSYKDREPVLMTGVMGTHKAEDLSKFAKQVRMSKLEAETRANMPMKNKELQATAAKNGVKLSGTMPKTELTVEPAELDQASYLAEYGEVCKLMDEGKAEEAKVRLKKWMGRAPTGNETGPETETHMNELADSVKKMQTQFESYIELSGQISGLTTLVSK